MLMGRWGQYKNIGWWVSSKTSVPGLVLILISYNLFLGTTTNPILT